MGTRFVSRRGASYERFGKLATNTPAGLGLASLTNAIKSQLTGINSQLGGINTRNDLDGRTTKALNGVSMAFAIAGTPWLLPTERFAVSMDWGTFQGINAVALNAAPPRHQRPG